VAGRWVDVRRDKARFVASRFSNALDLQVPAVDRVALREAVRHSIVREWTTVVVRIPPVLAVRVSRHVREWAGDRVDRLRACRPNRQDVQGRNRVVRDSAISMDLKKVR
jgi:hypothetical protein